MEAKKCIGQKKGGEPCGSWPRKGLLTCKRHRDQEAPGDIRHREPIITTPLPVAVQERVNARRYWPKGKALPETYQKIRRQTMPCQKCRRVLTDDVGQAVICTSSGIDIAWFRCRVCKYKWCLPVETVSK